MLGVRVPPGLPNFLILGLGNAEGGTCGSRGADSMIRFFQKTKDFFRAVVEFIKDTRKELHNVSWPSRRELVSTTVVVIVAVFFFGFFLWAVDIVVSPAMNFMINRLSR
jgi:preprotein translocase subunit SecE